MVAGRSTSTSGLPKLLAYTALVITGGYLVWQVTGAPLLQKWRAEKEAKHQAWVEAERYKVYPASRYGPGKPRSRIDLQPHEETPVIRPKGFWEWWGWMELSGCVEVTMNERYVFEQCEIDENAGLWGNSSLWGNQGRRSVRFKAKEKPVSILLFSDVNSDVDMMGRGGGRDRTSLILKEETPTGRFAVRPGVAVSLLVKRESPRIFSDWGTTTLRTLTWTVTGGCVHVHTEERSTRSCPGEEGSATALVDNIVDFEWMVVHAYEDEAIMEVSATFGKPRRYRKKS